MILVLASIVAFGFWFAIGASKISLLWREPLAALTDLCTRDPITPQKVLGRSISWFILNLLECPACTGFWIGVLFAKTDPAQSMISGTTWVTGWIWGFYFLTTNLIIARIAGLTVDTSHDAE
jgi:hypothetical protein